MKKTYKYPRSVAASQRELKNSNCLTNMRKLNLLIVTLSFVFAFFMNGIDGFSQTSLVTLIENTRENSKTLISARQYYEAEMMETRTGNSPYNPEIEYAYLWGSPDQLGDRVDFAVTQSFDFPTAYSSRSKLSKIKRGQAGLRLKASEQNIIVKAHQAWVMAVYLNQKSALINQRLENAQLIANAFQRMYSEGEANQLQFNQAKLKVSALTNEFSRLQMDISKNNAAISQLIGGNTLIILDSVFMPTMDIVLDTLINWHQFGALNASFQGEVVKMEQQKDVVFNQKLPKLKAGYYQETILGTQLKGITAGITIPLWENANQVKSAKAGLIFAQSDAARFWEQLELQVRQLFDQWTLLNSQVSEIQELLLNSNNDDLLLKALESGEISLTQYYYETDFYFQNKFDLLNFQRDLYLIEAELLRASY